LHALRSMDVRIAMNDFGAGYALLSQLARFPFDKIKIDRSLSGFDGNNPKNRAIVRAIAALAQSLGVSTMAEGWRLRNSLSGSRRTGVIRYKGYYFGRPVPASELEKVVARLRSPSPAPAPSHCESLISRLNFIDLYIAAVTGSRGARRMWQRSSTA